MEFIHVLPCVLLNFVRAVNRFVAFIFVDCWLFSLYKTNDSYGTLIQCTLIVYLYTYYYIDMHSLVVYWFTCFFWHDRLL